MFHVMLDLETLGTRPNAAIIQIGAVLFEPVSGGKILNHKGFNSHVKLQDGAGTIDHGAFVFWLKEKSAATMGKNLEDRAILLGDALAGFDQWPNETVPGLQWRNIQGVWASPADFDLPIIRNAYALMGSDVPWDRRVTRDARTLFDLAGGKPEIDWTGMTPHDALDDAIGQAMQVQKAMGLLK